MILLSVWLQLSFGEIDVKIFLIFGKKYSIATDGLKIHFGILVLFWYTLFFSTIKYYYYYYYFHLYTNDNNNNYYYYYYYGNTLQ